MTSSSDENKVSVIIPTYNRAPFLTSAVHSIISQVYNNIEILIIDDKSDDDTRAVVKKLQQKYPSVLYFHNERAKGPSGARNTGITKSSGDYICFLDSDDIWLEGHLKKGLEVFYKYPEIDVLFGNFRVVDYKSGKHLYNFFDQKDLLHDLKAVEISPGTMLLQDNLFMALIQGNFFHLGSIIVRKASMKGILLDENIMFAEDRDFAINLYKEANATFAFRKEPVFELLRHDSNLCNTPDSANEQDILEAHLHLFSKYLKLYDLSNIEKKVLNRQIVQKLSALSYIHGRKKEYRNALSCIVESLKYGFTSTQFKALIKLFLFI